MITTAKEFEVGNLVTHTQYPIIAINLAQLYACHGKRKIARLAILKFPCHVVLQCNIYSEQRTEHFSYADRRYVIH